MPKELLPKAHNPNFNDHKINLPFRMCIVAPSGSGKTNFLLNLIQKFSSGQGTFATITILTKVAKEPLYDYLKLKSESVVIKEGLSNLPPLDKFDKDDNHLVVCDDLVLSKDLSPVENYFIRCRKFNVSIIFISQSYYHIPTMIRRNSSYIVILKLGAGKRELKMLMGEIGGQLDTDQLLNMYNYATDTKFVPLLVDCDQPDRYQKFRKGFLEVLNPDDFRE